MIRKIVRNLVIASLAVVGVAILLSRRFEDLFLNVQLTSLKRIWDRDIGEEQSRRLLDRVRGCYEEIEQRRTHFEKGVMRFLRAQTIIGIAIYRALLDEMQDRQEAIKETERLIWEVQLKILGNIIGFSLGLRKDPFDRFERVLPYINRYVFPTPPYERTDVEVAGGVGFDFTKCYTCEFLKDECVPELTIAFCNQDWRLAKLYPRQIEYQRDHCMGEGAEFCDFRYFRR
jgi:hypothetical protein